MNKANLVGVHEAGIAHHVAAISKVDRQDSAAAILDSAGAVVMKFFVRMRIDVPAWEHLFDVCEEFNVDGHHVFKVPVHRTIFDHPNLAIAFDDLSFDFPDFFIDQNTHVLLAADDRFPGLDYTVWTKRIRSSRPA